MKLAIIFTGGTIAGKVNDGFIEASSGNKYRLLERFEGDADIFEPYLILSENLNAKHLTELLEAVEKCIVKDYDGIIVTHGTDSLAYAAAAVGYAFGNNTCPVVFVSSNYILDDERANGYANFDAARKFIECRGGRGVFVAYKNTGECPKIHRAARIMPFAPYSDRLLSVDAVSFGSSGGEYGSFSDGRFIKNPNFREYPDAVPPFGAADMSFSSVLRASVYPGMPIPSGFDALLLETYHSGTVPEDIINAIAGRVYIFGCSDRVQYVGAKAYNRKNISVLPPMSPSAAYVKLWMATCTERFDAILKPLAGDFPAVRGFEK